MSKTILTKEVAGAIESLRSKGITPYGIVKGAVEASELEECRTLHVWAVKRDGLGTIEELMDALVNGYEVAQTPEEKVREYYEDLIKFAATDDRAESVVTTLDLLGIKISGVNAE